MIKYLSSFVCVTDVVRLPSVANMILAANNCVHCTGLALERNHVGHIATRALYRLDLKAKFVPILPCTADMVIFRTIRTLHDGATDFSAQ